MNITFSANSQSVQERKIKEQEMVLDKMAAMIPNLGTLTGGDKEALNALARVASSVGLGERLSVVA